MLMLCVVVGLLISVSQAAAYRPLTLLEMQMLLANPGLFPLFPPAPLPYTQTFITPYGTQSLLVVPSLLPDVPGMPAPLIIIPQGVPQRPGYPLWPR